MICFRLTRFHLVTFLTVAVGVCQAHSLAAHAQQSDRPPVTGEAPLKLKAESNLVVVRVVVRDSHGAPVTGLKKEDFKLFDGGKEQVISQFEESAGETPAQIPAPGEGSSTSRHIAIFFDVLDTPTAAMMQARDALDSRLAAILQPRDRVAIFTSDQILSDFTSDPKQIHQALFELQTSTIGTNRRLECPNISDYQALQITRSDNDAVKLAWDEQKSCAVRTLATSQSPSDPAPNQQSVSAIQMLSRRIVEQSHIQARSNLQQFERVVKYVSALQGDRTVILVSPGFPSMSEQQQLDRIIDRALRSQVIVNSVDPNGVVVLMRGASERYAVSADSRANQTMHSMDSQAALVAGDVLAELAQGTGGAYIHGTNDLRGSFETLAGHPANYVLAFSPREMKQDGKFHPLKVTLAAKQKGTSIQARRGYFAVAPTADATVEAAQAQPSAPNTQTASAANSPPPGPHDQPHPTNAPQSPRSVDLTGQLATSTQAAPPAENDSTATHGSVNHSYGHAERVLCDRGSERFENKFPTGVTVKVGAGRRGDLAERTCDAVLKWNHQELAIVPEAMQIDIDVLGADLGMGKRVLAVQVRKTTADPSVTYEIYSLEKPPLLLRTITGGSYFNAADVDLEGRTAIWTGDAAAIDGFDGLAFADFDFAPTMVLRFDHERLVDVTSEFTPQIDQQIALVRAHLDGQQLRDFASSDGKLLPDSLPLDRLRRLRSTKVKVLEIVRAYLYSGREPEAWRTLAASWPAADLERVRALILAARAHGMLSQTETPSVEGFHASRKKHAYIFDTGRDTTEGGNIPAAGGSPTGTAMATDAGKVPIGVPMITDTRPEPILLRLPAPPKDHQELRATEEFIDIVVDAAGKVRSAVMFQPSVDDALIRSSVGWKFIPAFKMGAPVASRMRLAVSASR